MTDQISERYQAVERFAAWKSVASVVGAITGLTIAVAAVGLLICRRRQGHKPGHMTRYKVSLFVPFAVAGALAYRLVRQLQLTHAPSTYYIMF